MKSVLIAGLFAACFAAPAFAQTEQMDQVDRSQSQAIANDMQARLNAAPDPTLQPVESLTCEQMYAEMFTAGQQMNSQLDPSFASNVQTMRDDAESRHRAGMATGVGIGLACSIPGVGMACGAMMQAQIAGQMRQAQQSQQQMDVIMGQMNDATQGIDLARMQSVSQRWESEGCQAPEGAAPPH